MGEVCKKTGGSILAICTSYDTFLHKELLSEVAMIALALKFLLASIF